jgi:hypothetical protein
MKTNACSVLPESKACGKRATPGIILTHAMDFWYCWLRVLPTEVQRTQSHGCSTESLQSNSFTFSRCAERPVGQKNLSSDFCAVSRQAQCTATANFPDIFKTMNCKHRPSPHPKNPEYENRYLFHFA